MADNGLRCQFCNRELGNEGAKVQHERACDHNPQNQIQPQSGRQQLVRQPEVETRPARQQDGGGAGVADTLWVLTNFDEMPPEQRREAINRGSGFLGGLLNRWLDLRDASQNKQQARARNAELEPVVELPTCTSCEYQFSEDELVGNQVRCPSCESLFNINVRSVDEVEA